MLYIEERIAGFTKLGEWLQVELDKVENEAGHHSPLEETILRAGNENGWFKKAEVLKSLRSLLPWLQPDTLQTVVKKYFLSEPPKRFTVAVIMAGNIPLVNFHDFFAVLLTGHRFLGKLSSQDRILLPFLAEQMISMDARWKEYISFTEERLEEFDAVIATGSNNSARYFEYYFGKYPHIIRGNRTSLALITGKETEDDFKALFNDVFTYFGLGCRNVSMLLVPQGYDFKPMFDAWQEQGKVLDHHKYINNYDYYRSIFMINKVKFYDTGFASVMKSEQQGAQVSVLHYTEYQDMEEAYAFIEQRKEQLQCIVCTDPLKDVEVVSPGHSQQPGVFDYPDGVDIVTFLLAL